MKDELTEFDSLLQSLAAEKLSPVGTHRTPDELAAYHFHQVSAEEEEQIQEHLVTCRTCTMSLLDLAELCASEPATPVSPALPAPPTEAKAPASASFFQRLRAQLFPRRLFPAFAALSLLLSLSLLVWVVSLKREQQTLLAQLRQQESSRAAETSQEIALLQQQKNEALARAEQMTAQAEQARRALSEEQKKEQLNPPVIDVLPQEQRAAGATIPEIARSAGRFTLVIPATVTEPKYADYEIEILSKSGSVVFNKKGMALTSAGSFTILLPSQLFTAGEYRINVYGLGRGAKARVAGGVIRFR